MVRWEEFEGEGRGYRVGYVQIMGDYIREIRGRIEVDGLQKWLCDAGAVDRALDLVYAGKAGGTFFKTGVVVGVVVG